MNSQAKRAENNTGWKGLELPTKFGVVVTAVVFIAIGIYAYIVPGAFKNIIGDANEMGDFLAGTAGTLALVWLIVGYFLQSKELAQNTDALQDQKKEFEKQVIELNKQVSATNKMADAMLRMAKSNESLVKFYESQSIKEERERLESVKPIFAIGGGNSARGGRVQYKITNQGNEVQNLQFHIPNDDVNYHKNVIPLFKNGQYLGFDFLVNQDTKWPIVLEIEYDDIHGYRFKECFEFTNLKKLEKLGDRQLISKD